MSSHRYSAGLRSVTCEQLNEQVQDARLDLDCMLDNAVLAEEQMYCLATVEGDGRSS